MSTTTKRIDMTGAEWVTPPEAQGQTIECSYARVEGGVVCRTVDHSEQTVHYQYASEDDMDSDTYEPWNREPRASQWIPVAPR